MKTVEMISITVSEMTAKGGSYRLLNSIVTPRPIAWVSTISGEGITNLAPFSFFNVVSGEPPTIMISVGKRAGEPKDTLKNIEETGEFVVNLVDELHTEAMNHTSGDWVHGHSEFDVTGLQAIPSIDVRPPYVAGVPVAMEAKLTQLVPVKNSTSVMVLGQVVRFHIREGLLMPDGSVDTLQMHLIARLGGAAYVKGGEVFHLDRPKV